MTIRVFVGAAPSGEDAESLAVLEYTLRKHASRPVEIVFMTISRDPASFWHGWDTSRWATPFSGFRWGIPAACGFEGKAIYTDSDVIFMRDPAELFDQDVPAGKVVLGKGGGSWRLCVSLWDCAAAEAVMLPLADLKARPDAHREMGRRIQPHIGAFAGHWNVLDGEGFADPLDPAVGAHHYTDMSAQYHLKHALPRLAREGRKHWFDGVTRPHPRQDLQAMFDDLLAEAVAAGYRPEDYVPAEPFGAIAKASLTNYRGRARVA